MWDPHPPNRHDLVHAPSLAFRPTGARRSARRRSHVAEDRLIVAAVMTAAVGRPSGGVGVRRLGCAGAGTATPTAATARNPRCLSGTREGNAPLVARPRAMARRLRVENPDRATQRDRALACDRCRSSGSRCSGGRGRRKVASTRSVIPAKEQTCRHHGRVRRVARRCRRSKLAGFAPVAGLPQGRSIVDSRSAAV